MSIRKISVMACLAMVVAVPVAQADDATYCKALWTKFKGAVTTHQSRNDVAVAASQCDNPAKAPDGIAFFEKELKAIKVELPARN